MTNNRTSRPRPRPRAATAGLLLLLAFGGAACATTGSGRTGNPDVITREEIREADATTALDVVERLRPLWLRAPLDRSTTRATELVVFLNGVMVGDVQTLRDIDAMNVERIRWLDSAQAGQLPGLGSRHVAGAIMVATF